MFRNISKIFFLFLIIFSTQAHADQIPIYSCDELQNISKNLSAEYYLANDLDCHGLSMEPVQGTFKGKLSGKDNTGTMHIIRNLEMRAKRGADGGLFAQIQGATISDIRFENISVYSDDNTSRGLIAGHISKATLNNISGKNIQIRGATTYDSFDPWSQWGRSGGIAGFAGESTFSNIHLTDVQVKQHTYAGGLVGETFILRIDNCSVKNLSSLWEWQRTEPYPEGMTFGGLIGRAAGADITRSSATGSISGVWATGGLIGTASWGVNIENSYSHVNVHAYTYAGGLIGRSFSTVTLSHVYATGHVQGSEGRGMIGSKKQHGDTPSVVTEGYFDKNTTKRENSGDDGSQARSTKRMTKEHPKTFSAEKGWSREIWVFPTGEYPSLKM